MRDLEGALSIELYVFSAGLMASASWKGSSAPVACAAQTRIESNIRALMKIDFCSASAWKLGGLELCKLALQGVVTLITQALPLPLSELIEVLSEPQPACRIS